jgi:tellurium resistance protein TerZ
MISLQKGQTISLAKTGGAGLRKVVMGLGWDVRKPKKMFGIFGGDAPSIDLDASCLLFDANGGLFDQVWFRQLKSKDGSIVHTGDNLTGAGDGDDEQIIVELERLPAQAKTLVFTVSSFRGDTFDQIENAYCRLLDAAGNKELGRYDLSGSGPHTGQVMAKLVRGGDGWSFTAIGERTGGRTFHDMMPAISAHV